jgi:release factor glutamine methyltransferase
VSTLSGVEAVVDRAVDAGFESETVAAESFPFETLSVLRLSKR